jgi:23S rRNA pseudouridine1911/1915/1917 synthase
VKVSAPVSEKKTVHPEAKTHHSKEEHISKNEDRGMLRIKQSANKNYLKIIHEDRDIIVVDKPAGVLSEPKHDSPWEDIVNMTKSYLKRKWKDSKDSFVKPVHRLDAEASGLLVLAKSGKGIDLMLQFRDRTVKKQYMVIVEGRVENNEGEIKEKIEKANFSHGRKAHVGTGEHAKSAATEYVVKERYDNATLLQVSILAGRTQQIRVHMSSMGHPVIGDRAYGSNFPFPRIALHSSKLIFKHPGTHHNMELKCDLPNDLEKLIDQLRHI